jgi:hypothetical protein
MNGQVGFKIGDKIIPRELKDRRENELGNSAQAGNIYIVGASVRGKLHHYNDTPRDDAFAAYFNGKWLAVAVSDGAGSRTLSRHGASCLARRLCTRLVEAASISEIPADHVPIKFMTQNKNNILIPRLSSEGDRIKQQMADLVAHNDKLSENERDYLNNIMRKAFRQTRNDLDVFASKIGFRLDDFHSTLLGLLLNTKTGEMGVGQIGDGLILGLDNEKEAKLLAEPPTTDDPGASYFITQDDWEQYLDTRVMPGVEMERFSTFYLMTDGVANDCQYGPPLDILNIWANDIAREIRLVPSQQVTAERLKSYLTNYKAKGSFDDRTLVVIYKNSEDRVM